MFNGRRRSCALMFAFLLSASTTIADVIDDAQKLLRDGQGKQAVQLLEAAIANAETVVKADPKDAAAQFELARLHFELQHDELARTAIDAAISINPDDPKFRALSALMHFYASQPEKAENEYQKAIELSDGEPRFRHEYAKFLAGTDRPADAEKQLREALKKEPNFLPGLLDLATLSAAHERSDEAVSLLQSALEREPKNVELLDSLGQLFQELERHQDAYAQFAAIGAIDENNIRAEAKMLQLSTALEKTDDAERHLKRVHELQQAGHATQPWFCREQFTTSKCRVVAAEYFELNGPSAVKYLFEVTPLDASKESFSISLGSYDLTTDVARSQGVIGKDERMFHLDRYEGRRHQTLGMYPKTPPEYSFVRQAVIDTIAGKKAPISESERPKQDANAPAE